MIQPVKTLLYETFFIAVFKKMIIHESWEYFWHKSCVSLECVIAHLMQSSVPMILISELKLFKRPTLVHPQGIFHAVINPNLSSFGGWSGWINHCLDGLLLVDKRKKKKKTQEYWPRIEVHVRRTENLVLWINLDN